MPARKKKRKYIRKVKKEMKLGAGVPPPIVEPPQAAQNTMGGLQADLVQAREALGLAESAVRADEVALVNSKVELQIAQAREAMAAEALRHAAQRLLLGETL